MVSERARRASGTALAVLAAAFLAPAAALASGPGVDEYTLNIPGAGGNHPQGGGPPTADPGSLPPQVQRQLTGPQGRLLATVATAPELGAPHPTGASGHQVSPNDGSVNQGPGGGQTQPGSSVAGAALRTAGDGTTLVLLAGAILVALAASGALLRRRGAAA